MLFLNSLGKKNVFALKQYDLENVPNYNSNLVFLPSDSWLHPARLMLPQDTCRSGWLLVGWDMMGALIYTVALLSYRYRVTGNTIWQGDRLTIHYDRRNQYLLWLLTEDDSLSEKWRIPESWNGYLSLFYLSRSSPIHLSLSKSLVLAVIAHPGHWTQEGQYSQWCEESWGEFL